ncbi:thioesterase superfamily protein [Halovivax asiaticus JCM 14624]|uniref:Thioesterase superfamily protein n=1 Tax=Halovivax asiaticus JCM 14624 TaxID=1227490 RepID=M0BLE2_9EURY|nr:acyl-CoA thioesterase [Halovivax asiaticus]ELZ11706.1 thioesterase superfamily protein [Halovivax asiaticus JCM 14624]
MPTLLETRIRNRFRVEPHHANSLGTLHGGNLMRWLDEVGTMAATRFAGEPCVTAGVTELAFERPLHVGDTALIEAYVFDAGETSAEVALRAWRENPQTGDTERTTASSFTFVAIDEAGETVSVPDLDVETDEGATLRERARSR